MPFVTELMFHVNGNMSMLMVMIIFKSQEYKCSFWKDLHLFKFDNETGNKDNKTRVKSDQPDKRFLVKKKFWVENILGLKIFLAEKYIWLKTFLCPKNALVLKIFGPSD